MQIIKFHDQKLRYDWQENKTCARCDEWRNCRGYRSAMKTFQTQPKAAIYVVMLYRVVAIPLFPCHKRGSGAERAPNLGFIQRELQTVRYEYNARQYRTYEENCSLRYTQNKWEQTAQCNTQHSTVYHYSVLESFRLIVRYCKITLIVV